MTDILVSQGVQDITGQLIRRVITLVTQVEGQLVKLMDMAARVERLSSLESAEDIAASDDTPVRANKVQVMNNNRSMILSGRKAPSSRQAKRIPCVIRMMLMTCFPAWDFDRSSL